MLWDMLLCVQDLCCKQTAAWWHVRYAAMLTAILFLGTCCSSKYDNVAVCSLSMQMLLLLSTFYPSGAGNAFSKVKVCYCRGLVHCNEPIGSVAHTQLVACWLSSCPKHKQHAWNSSMTT
jgi:hypothetical protein